MKVNSKLIQTALWVMLVITVFVLGSCKGYLDLKPDKSRVLPESLIDAQALLDNYPVMNTNYPGQAEAASDNFFLPDAAAAALQLNDRDNYIWTAQGLHNVSSWQNPYKAVFYANLVLQMLGKLPATGADYDQIRGAALFYRSYAFYQVAQVFALGYDSKTSATDPGIILRLTPDLDIKSTRSSVKHTYEQIILDLTTAVSLLPVTSTVKSRPNRASAYAMLARTYLAMQDYVNAGKMADESLKLYHVLIDYKTFTGTITRFNAEVLFHAENMATATLNPSSARIDRDLYDSYQANDRRKILYFRTNTDNTRSFKWSYTGSTNTILFNGLATDEIYLIRAECHARLGNTALAMNDLNTLLRNRYDATFVDKTAGDPQSALDTILAERRKELIMRGLRWTDLRRLNKESRYAKDLTRMVSGLTYTLPAEDLRYALLIPQEVLEAVNISQNAR